MVRLCDQSLSMGLEKDRLAYSNLGGHGPDFSWKDGMMIDNLFSDVSVSLGITVQGTYYPLNATRNSVRGDMVVISLTPG